MIMKKQILNEFFNSPAPEVVDRLKPQISSMVMDAIKEEFPFDFETFNPELKAVTIDQIFYMLKERIKKDMGLTNDIDKAKKEREDEENQLNSEINESIKKLKTDFKRFL